MASHVGWKSILMARYYSQVHKVMDLSLPASLLAQGTVRGKDSISHAGSLGAEFRACNNPERLSLAFRGYFTGLSVWDWGEYGVFRELTAYLWHFGVRLKIIFAHILVQQHSNENCSTIFIDIIASKWIRALLKLAYFPSRDLSHTPGYLA